MIDDESPICYCKSCGVALVDHLGLNGTCALKLRYAKALDDIIKHMEFVGGSMASRSTVYRIAKNALGETE